MFFFAEQIIVSDEKNLFLLIISTLTGSMKGGCKITSLLLGKGSSIGADFGLRRLHVLRHELAQIAAQLVRALQRRSGKMADAVFSLSYSST